MDISFSNDKDKARDSEVPAKKEPTPIKLVRPSVAPVVKPEVAKPEVARLVITETKVTKTTITKTEAAKTEATKPVEPVVTKTESTKTEVRKIDTGITKPVGTKPEAVKPEASKPELLLGRPKAEPIDFSKPTPELKELYPQVSLKREIAQELSKSLKKPLEKPFLDKSKSPQVSKEEIKARQEASDSVKTALSKPGLTDGKVPFKNAPQTEKTVAQERAELEARNKAWIERQDKIDRGIPPKINRAIPAEKKAAIDKKVKAFMADYKPSFKQNYAPRESYVQAKAFQEKALALAREKNFAREAELAAKRDHEKGLKGLVNKALGRKNKALEAIREDQKSIKIREVALHVEYKGSEFAQKRILEIEKREEEAVKRVNAAVEEWRKKASLLDKLAMKTAKSKWGESFKKWGIIVDKKIEEVAPEAGKNLAAIREEKGMWGAYRDEKLLAQEREKETKTREQVETSKREAESQVAKKREAEDLTVKQEREREEQKQKIVIKPTEHSSIINFALKMQEIDEMSIEERTAWLKRMRTRDFENFGDKTVAA
ncbi:MAG: hypothetical protein ACYDBP_07185 [Leptospirales bacterium]